MDMFFIKKNATASLNSWLSIVGFSLPRMTYGSLSDSLYSNTRLISFNTQEEAGEFITKNPEICNENCNIHQMLECDGKIEMIPV
ncbi:MAG: hypothetical protein ABIT47_00510 [Candidatus Paceibacterota bacterium]